MDSWTKLAASVGMLLVDEKLRRSLGTQLRDRVGNLGGSISNRYEDAVGRLEAAADALQGRNAWPTRMTALLMGVGIGAGVGMLLAPAAGSDTRRAIRDKTVEFKNKVVENTTSAMGRSDEPSDRYGTQG